ncbi:MAG: peptidylprolyl isomerase, partial [Rhodobacteraceae bacterium]
MLGSMRASKKNQTLVWVIFGLLVIGLIGFGGATSGPGTIRSVAQVGDEKISVDSYVAAVQNRIQVVSQQFGRNLSGPEAQALGVQQAVLSELITSAAIDNEAAKIGLSLGDEAVRSELLTTDAFLGLDGKFNKESYNLVLERSQLSPTQYDEILRKNAARTMVNTAITSGVGAQDSQTLQILTYVAEQRDFSWVELTDSDLDSPITPPNETEIQAQYDTNTATYTAPLTRKITYVLLTPEMLESEAEIDEADLQEAYKLQNDRFNQAERRLVERLVFSDQAEAETARNALDAGTKTFDDLLKERGLSANDADLGEIEINDVSKDAATVVFGSSDAGVVGPVQSSLGPALYRINAILKAESTSFEEARDELTAELAGEITRR